MICTTASTLGSFSPLRPTWTARKQEAQARGKFNIIREPAILLTLVATVVRLLTAHWLNTSPDTQAVVNAFVTAAAGVIVAVWVKHNGALPALLGFVQAAIALGVGFGWNISADQQALVMSVLGGIVALFTRTQVTAPGTPPPAALR